MSSCPCCGKTVLIGHTTCGNSYCQEYSTFMNLAQNTRLGKKHTEHIERAQRAWNDRARMDTQRAV